MFFALARSSYLIRSKLMTTLQHRTRFGCLKPLTSVHAMLTSSDRMGSSSGQSKHTITFQPYKPPCLPKQHDYKNMALKRPMSPHLTIYAPTLPAMTSIFQRITGIILVFYAVMLSVGSLFLSNGVETYVSMIQSLDLNRLSIFVVKIIVGIPFAFHYFNGIRFCMWNAGRWLAMRDVYDSAKKCFIAATVLCLLFSIL